MNQENEILTAEETAAYLRLHIDTLYRYTATGLIPGFRVGKLWRYRREALANWVAPNKASHDSNPKQSVEAITEQVGE